MGATENNKYYYKKYNQLLTDEFIDSMDDVSDSVKSELKKLNNAIENIFLKWLETVFTVIKPF